MIYLMSAERPKLSKAPTVGALGEAQSAGNGMPFIRSAPKVSALGDAALANFGRSLQASQEAVICVVG